MIQFIQQNGNTTIHFYETGTEPKFPESQPIIQIEGKFQNQERTHWRK